MVDDTKKAEMKTITATPTATKPPPIINGVLVFPRVLPPPYGGIEHHAYDHQLIDPTPALRECGDWDFVRISNTHLIPRPSPII